MSRPSVSVNIVNWNGKAHLQKCLDSVFVQDYGGPFEVILVDNGSSDGSLEVVERLYPRVRIIRNGSNLGFCRAHNQAIRASSSEFVLVLNFDIYLEPDFLTRMVEGMGEKCVGMVSGKLFKLLDGRKSDILDTTGIVMRHYFPSPRGEMEKDSGGYDRPECRDIFGPCGAAPLYRRAMLEDVRHEGQYFDEGFGSYVEDVDLAWRGQLAGWKAVYIPEAVAYHVRGATRSSDAAEQRNYFLQGFRNRYLAMYKNITGRELRTWWPQILLTELHFFFLSGKASGSSWLKLHSFLKACRAMPRLRPKRRFIQERVRVDPRQVSCLREVERGEIRRMAWKVLRDLAGIMLNYCYGTLVRYKAGRILRRGYRAALGKPCT